MQAYDKGKTALSDEAALSALPASALPSIPTAAAAGSDATTRAAPSSPPSAETAFGFTTPQPASGMHAPAARAFRAVQVDQLDPGLGRLSGRNVDFPAITEASAVTSATIRAIEADSLLPSPPDQLLAPRPPPRDGVVDSDAVSHAPTTPKAQGAKRSRVPESNGIHLINGAKAFNKQHRRIGGYAL